MLHDPLDVVQLEQGVDRGVAAGQVAQVLALDAGAVAEHHVEDVAGGAGHVDRPGVAGAGQARDLADVVVVRVRDDDRVEGARVERELAVRAVGAHPVRVEEPAVQEDAVRADLQKDGRCRSPAGPPHGT